jgi:hypothetical protein
MLCKSELDPFKKWLPFKDVVIELLLPREVAIGVGLDVMVIRRDSE